MGELTEHTSELKDGNCGLQDKLLKLDLFDSFDMDEGGESLDLIALHSKSLLGWIRDSASLH